MVRRALGRRAVLLALALVAGCLSPTLPLPPPEAPDSIALVTDAWVLRGTCQPGATVLAVREATGDGVVVEDLEASGRYRIVLAADECEVVTLRQIDGEDLSAPIRVVLQETEGGVPVDRELCR